MNAKIQNFDTICKLFPEKFANERKKVTLSKQVSHKLHTIKQAFTAKVTLSSVFANFHEMCSVLNKLTKFEFNLWVEM